MSRGPDEVSGVVRSLALELVILTSDGFFYPSQNDKVDSEVSLVWATQKPPSSDRCWLQTPHCVVERTGGDLDMVE